jgi:hypothetical protein
MRFKYITGARAPTHTHTHKVNFFFENVIVPTPNNKELNAAFFNIGLPLKFISTVSKNTLDSKFNKNPFNSTGDEVEKSRCEYFLMITGTRIFLA